MTERSAWEVPGGRLVRMAVAGVLCLKAQRRSRDYVNHYLVPLEPLPEGLRAMRLLYIDPDERLIEVATHRLDAVDARLASAAEIGDILVNAAGRFLKVGDTAKTERPFAYVDLDSGEVRPRQERTISQIMRWRVVATSEFYTEQPD